MSAAPISPADEVVAYGLLLSIGILAVLAACLVLLGVRWLGRRDR